MLLARLVSRPLISVHARPHSYLSGFGYDFNTLDNGEEANELSRAFSTLFGAPPSSRHWMLLQAWIPPLRLIVRLSLYPSSYLA